MEPVAITKRQARQFILIKQGLMGSHRFTGKSGVLEYVRQAGCIQFDPIDVCGKNAELTLQSRVKGFSKEMLYEMLYEDRSLVDYFDKNLAIIDVHDWKYFERIRESHRRHGRGKNDVEKVADSIKLMISEKGPLCSKDIGLDEKVDWYWNSTKLSRAALETLYFRGELIVHHKKGTIKYYSLAKDHIPKGILQEKDPHSTELEHMTWRLLRRIAAVGLIWNKPSDAWLNIANFKAKERAEIFQQLLSEGLIMEVAVEGVKDKLYCLSKDMWIMEELMRIAGEGQKSKMIKPRTELMAPLDNMLWDRRLIKELFDFDYKWEIYTPENQRKYGYYVLPVLSGDSFAGRTEVLCDRKNGILKVQKIWLENKTRRSGRLVSELLRCYERFKAFHGLKEICYSEECKYILNIGAEA